MCQVETVLNSVDYLNLKPGTCTCSSAYTYTLCLGIIDVNVLTIIGTILIFSDHEPIERMSMEICLSVGK